MCHNTKCCNPEHLLIGTQKENYHDSLSNHKMADEKKRKTWVVDGVKYDTCRIASKLTGIGCNSIVKYTKDGIFDIQAYRDGCEVANRIPKNLRI